jgi:hypothetical protein
MVRVGPLAIPAWLRQPANPLTNHQKNPTPCDVILATTDVSNWCFGASALGSATFCGGNTTFGYTRWFCGFGCEDKRDENFVSASPFI